MPGLWFNNAGTREGKYLVKRRDGTIPDWPHFVLGAKDPVAPVALRAYANEAERLNLDPAYVRDIRVLADNFAQFRAQYGDGDPDAGRHRKDDPATVAEMAKGMGA